MNIYRVTQKKTPVKEKLVTSLTGVFGTHGIFITYFIIRFLRGLIYFFEKVGCPILRSLIEGRVNLWLLKCLTLH